MSIYRNVEILQRHINRYGWVSVSEDEAFKYYLNNSGIKLSFPIIQNDLEFGNMLKICLSKLLKHCPEIAKFSTFKLLMSQCQNLDNKYKPDKKDWILFEPDSRYSLGEIPDIYVPKKFIFEL
ncbi:hypothetical protein CKK33_13300 [Mucilaginibacter sp. MD40]|uniref:hypothetical protein n=1 Tax=Mucilaginibacter sp. MD40 TaxID=2029590 RepID=UPI000BACADB6|nr:hypothetical protein [Mucilaginibacter sp. MD40]PAW94412.1 hypothetical protein CKK33_13300 [Mucilaginibacter sp. MD40]